MKFHSFFWILSTLTLFSMKSGDSSILFYEGEYADALKHAKELHKPVFIDFYADWCTPCKQMEKYAFNDEEVYTHINNNFVAVKVNVEYFTGMDIADQFHIKTYPTIIILDQRGREKGRVTGYQTTKELLQFITPFHK